MPNQTIAKAASWKIDFSAWAIWNSDDTASSNEAPSLSFLDPMQRRRLSPLAKAALHVAHQCAGQQAKVRFVYASQHGELARTLPLLENLARQEALSPTTFGLSVLNATPGLYAIARRDTSAATAIAAGKDTLAWGLLEANLRAHDGDPTPVLFVYADTPPPYPLATESAQEIIALALLITPQTGRTLHCQQLPAGESPTSTSQVEILAKVLRSQQQSTWHGEQHGWSWRIQ